MKVIDLHSDIFTDIAFRRASGERNVLERIHLPRLRLGGVSGIIGVFWVEPIFKQQKKSRFFQLVNHVMADLIECSAVTIVDSPELILNSVDHDQLFIYLGIEGLAFLEEWQGSNKQVRLEDVFAELNQLSIKHSILVWNDANFLATGSGNLENNHSGLTSLGKLALGQFKKYQWIIDVSHLDQASFWDVLSETNQPILASHSNAYRLCPHERNLTDEQIKAIAKTDGLIGVNAYGSFVDQERPTLSRVVDHLSYMADLVGTNHLGFGFDFVDYLQEYQLGSNLANMTVGLEDASKIPDLLDEMIKRGFSYKEIEQIAFNNFLKFLSIIQKNK